MGRWLSVHFHVFELSFPGTWIRGLSDHAGHQLTTLLYGAETALADAALSLSHFEAALEGISSMDDEFAAEDQRAEWRRATEEEMEAQLPGDLSPEDRWERREEIRYIAELESRRRAWQEGKVPTEYRRRLPFLYARSFVGALENARKTLAAIGQVDPAIPEPVREAVDSLDADLPALKYVRDSIQHGDERARGQSRGKPLDLQPVDNDAMRVTGGAVFQDTLIGTRYGCTMADGEFGEVDISPTTAVRVTQAVQAVIDALDWHGPPRHVPR